MERGDRKQKTSKEEPESSKKRNERANEIRRGKERSHRSPWIQEGHVFQQYPNSKTDGSRLEGTANTRIVAGSMKDERKEGVRRDAQGPCKEPAVKHFLRSIPAPPATLQFATIQRYPRKFALAPALN
ncbi:hypothetical protein WN51_13181 [Melipona quadrifasciata]|uniref:Uncharacterized protein n=1 Tax=Melipona quadrifasciata TaxID=166423 RepID=A0A0N0BGU6_9HYME|nr:hypothetical protein WN51_13181 [Melipona quadrifasciata]